MNSDTGDALAVTQKNSKGRQHPEPRHRYRTDFERDRDRIVHSSAFRRLEGKTQVFTPGLDDFYRTRLTHSIEVAQIGRTIAKALHLNSDLTEAICLAHDLGHAPFGHAGEAALSDLMRPYGGFEHNSQALRIVDLLEHPYPDFAGLNLLYETRLGLARHSSTYDTPEVAEFAEKNCTLEGQIANIADRIAYNCHDLEDALRARIIDFAQLDKIELAVESKSKIAELTDPVIYRTRMSKNIIDLLVSDCIDASRKKIKEACIKSLDRVVEREDNLITLSEVSEKKLLELEEFLFNQFYRHASLIETAENVRVWLKQLFNMFCECPQKMPEYYQGFIDPYGLQRTVCDYVAGMTDRFCLKTLGKI